MLAKGQQHRLVRLFFWRGGEIRSVCSPTRIHTDIREVTVGGGRTYAKSTEQSHAVRREQKNIAHCQSEESNVCM